MIVYDAGDVRFSTAPGRVQGVLVYGPPRSWRGRLANHVRRLLGRDERNEVYAYFERIAST